MSIAVLVQTLLAAGVDHATIVAAVAAVETKEPARTARQDRNARYYDARKERLKASKNGLKSSDPFPDKEKIPHTPLKEINPSPSLRSVSSSAGELMLADAGVPAEVLTDWKAVRKAKRAGPITATVAKGLIWEANKAGMSAHNAVKMATERGWQGFKADWAIQQPRAGPAQTRPKSVIDHLRELDNGNDQSSFGSALVSLPSPEQRSTSADSDGLFDGGRWSTG